MKVIPKILLVAILTIVVLATIWWIWPERTPQIKSAHNTSIAQIEYINIGGLEQSVLIRSKNTNNPIVLFLHGGPGMPIMYLAHEFQRPLEENFTVVHWDRRGAGKTYFRNKPSIESMNLQQLKDDAFQLIDTLKNRYNQDKIFLIGHSFGTYLGSIMVSERPELFSAYVSVGQVVDDDKALKIQESFIRKQAALAGKSEIIDLLNQPDKPYFESWLFEFGGELKNSKSFFPLIWSGLRAPEYTLSEALKLAEASSFSSSNMKFNVLDNSIYYEIREYQIPVYFFVGMFDYTTPHELISEYHDLIKAPNKKLVYFENSAHFPFFEEPTKFCNEIERVLLKKTKHNNSYNSSL